MNENNENIDAIFDLLDKLITNNEMKYSAYSALHDQISFLSDSLKEQEPITGETSDGYHTFNELYHHRAVLFSVIVANYPERAWKSKKHNDGTMYDGMFIVGIETPDGQATYHYDIDPYWDMFKCRVLDKAPKWDGHTPAQAIERIGKLKEQPEQKHGHWIERDEYYECSACKEPWVLIDGTPLENGMYFCPKCGARMESEVKQE